MPGPILPQLIDQGEVTPLCGVSEISKEDKHVEMWVDGIRIEIDSDDGQLEHAMYIAKQIRAAFVNIHSFAGKRS